MDFTEGFVKGKVTSRFSHTLIFFLVFYLSSPPILFGETQSRTIIKNLSRNKNVDLWICREQAGSPDFQWGCAGAGLGPGECVSLSSDVSFVQVRNKWDTELQLQLVEGAEDILLDTGEFYRHSVQTTPLEKSVIITAAADTSSRDVKNAFYKGMWQMTEAVSEAEWLPEGLRNNVEKMNEVFAPPEELRFLKIDVTGGRRLGDGGVIPGISSETKDIPRPKRVSEKDFPGGGAVGRGMLIAHDCTGIESIPGYREPEQQQGQRQQEQGQTEQQQQEGEEQQQQRQRQEQEQRQRQEQEQRQRQEQEQQQRQEQEQEQQQRQRQEQEQRQRQEQEQRQRQRQEQEQRQRQEQEQRQRQEQEQQQRQRQEQEQRQRQEQEQRQRQEQEQQQRQEQEQRQRQEQEQRQRQEQEQRQRQEQEQQQEEQQQQQQQQQQTQPPQQQQTQPPQQQQGPTIPGWTPDTKTGDLEIPYTDEEDELLIKGEDADALSSVYFQEYAGGAPPTIEPGQEFTPTVPGAELDTTGTPSLQAGTAPGPRPSTFEPSRIFTARSRDDTTSR